LAQSPRSIVQNDDDDDDDSYYWMASKTSHSNLFESTGTEQHHNSTWKEGDALNPIERKIDSFLHSLEREQGVYDTEIWWDNNGGRIQIDKDNGVTTRRTAPPTVVETDPHRVEDIYSVSDDGMVTHVPTPEEFLGVEIYEEGCGLRTVEYLTEAFVMLPDTIYQAIEPDGKQQKMLSRSNS
jgi:hypothetical protein